MNLGFIKPKHPQSIGFCRRPAIPGGTAVLQTHEIFVQTSRLTTEDEYCGPVAVSHFQNESKSL
jgi:hypothetical protein